MDERPTGAAVPIGERVDGLELCVGDRNLWEHLRVGSTGELHEILYKPGNA